jgi:hypothetical protein
MTWLPLLIVLAVFGLLLLERRYVPARITTALNLVSFVVALVWGILIPEDRFTLFLIALLIGSNEAERRWGSRLSQSR